MVNKSTIIILIFVLVLLVIITTVSIDAESDVRVHLEEGKNVVQIEEYVYASDLVRWNPEIEYISYYDEFLNRRIAYVNVFGGVGDNFLTSPTKEYEISVKENIGITIRGQ